MKALTIIATILISTSVLFASNEETPAKTTSTTTVSGQVIDKITGEALAGVKIQLVNSNDIVYTDLDGNFKLSNITPGSYQIESSLISYSTSNVNVDCKNSQSNELEIMLDNK